MPKLTYKEILKIKWENENTILNVCPNCPKRSGIYFLLRYEDGFKYAYIGQAKNLLSRLADHLSGHQWIDISINKHGLRTPDNETGWSVNFLEFPESDLDEKEQFYIKKYADAGYQLRNLTAGGQGKGKHGLGNSKPPRNYYDGLKQGYKNARKEIAHLFELHLDCVTKKDPPTKRQEKAFQQFLDFINFEDENKSAE